MTWLSNMLRQEELKLSKEVVDKVAMTVGNSFLSLGLIASLGDTEKSRDSLLKVNVCFLLLLNVFVSSALAYCSQADGLYCWQHTQSRHITSLTKLEENHGEEVLTKSGLYSELECTDSVKIPKKGKADEIVRNIRVTTGWHHRKVSEAVRQLGNS